MKAFAKISILFFGLALTTAFALQSQEGGQKDGQMAKHCHEMMQRHENMQAQMETMDRKLVGLVGQMNQARGDAKVNAMAAVINELVEQRKQMRSQMMDMGPGMMGHMMEHMQGMEGMKGMSCPMMKGMMDKKPGT